MISPSAVVYRASEISRPVPAGPLHHGGARQLAERQHHPGHRTQQPSMGADLIIAMIQEYRYSISESISRSNFSSTN